MFNLSGLGSFKALNYSISTVILALIPVTLAIIFLELFINVSLYDEGIKCIEITDSYDIQMLIYYIISGVVHVIICGIIASQFAIENRIDTPYQKLRIVRITRAFFLLFVFVLVYFLDNINIKLAYLSHERLYILMSKSSYFKDLLILIPTNLKWFHLFSLFPFMLICFALSVMIYAGFYIGNEMYNFIDKQELNPDKLKEHVLNLHRLLRNYAQLLSIVLVSSTIATVLFFQVPVPLIADGAIQKSYSNVSMAIGICWGVIFSLTLLFLCICPYRLAHRKLVSIVQSDRVRNSPDLEEWILKYKSYYTFIWNLKLLAPIVSPAVSGILTTIISHVL
jgi:hypothetical protein